MSNDEDKNKDHQALQEALGELYRRVADVTERANTAMDSALKALDADDDLLRQRIKRASDRVADTVSKAGQLINRAEELVVTVLQEVMSQAGKAKEEAVTRHEPEGVLLHLVPDEPPAQAPGAAPDIAPGAAPDIAPGAAPDIAPGAAPDIQPQARANDRHPGELSGLLGPKDSHSTSPDVPDGGPGEPR